MAKKTRDRCFSHDHLRRRREKEQKKKRGARRASNPNSLSILRPRRRPRGKKGGSGRERRPFSLFISPSPAAEGRGFLKKREKREAEAARLHHLFPYLTRSSTDD